MNGPLLSGLADLAAARARLSYAAQMRAEGVPADQVCAALDGDQATALLAEIARLEREAQR